jgi:glycosyltransferase involved in cell wall biosynthesis
VQPQVVYHGVRIPEPNHPRQRPIDRRIVLGVAGRLVPIKGVGCLLRALATLRHPFTHVQLEIAGAGPEEEALRHEAAALGVGDSVTFLGWQRDVWPLVGRWDVFVQPSLDEGFGMAALEAMAAGLPVVGTSVGGLPELIDDGRTGYVVPPSDATALAGRLRELLVDPERRREMGTAGRRRVRERFSAERMAGDIGGIYDQLLAARRSLISSLPRSG